MKDFSFHKLTSKMTLWVCGAVLLTYTISLCITFTAELHNDTEIIRKQMKVEMVGSKHALENYFTGIENAARTAALLAEDYCKDDETRRQFEHCVAVETSSDIYRVKIVTPENKSSIKENWHYSYERGENWWSPPFYSPIDKRKEVCFSVPVRENDKITSVVAFFITTEHLDSIAIHQKPDEHYDISIKNKNGDYLVLPDDEIVHGVDALVATAQLKNSWQIIFTYPKHIIKDIILKRIFRGAIWMLVILIVISISIIITIRYIAKPFVEKQTKESHDKAEIEKELSIASNIQKSVLKPFQTEREYAGCNMYAMSRSARFVGGDLYDYDIHNGKLAFCIGDVSGKGSTASLIMFSVINLFRHKAHLTDDPAEIMRDINYIHALRNPTCIFTTMFVGVYDPETNIVNYSCAGHNPPIIMRKNGNAEYLPMQSGIPLGIDEDVEYTDEQFTLDKGDMLVLYTDGITEAANKQEQLYGEDKTLEFAKEHHQMNPQEFSNALLTDIAKFVDGAEQSDDITLMCIKTDEK